MYVSHTINFKFSKRALLSFFCTQDEIKWMLLKFSPIQIVLKFPPECRAKSKQLGYSTMLEPFYPPRSCSNGLYGVCIFVSNKSQPNFVDLLIQQTSPSRMQQHLHWRRNALTACKNAESGDAALIHLNNVTDAETPKQQTAPQYQVYWNISCLFFFSDSLAVSAAPVYFALCLRIANARGPKLK